MYNTEQSTTWKLPPTPQEDVIADEIECPKNVRQSPTHTWASVPCWLGAWKSPPAGLCVQWGDRLQIRQADRRTLQGKCSVSWGDSVSSMGTVLLFIPQVRSAVGLSASYSPVLVTLSHFFSLPNR